MCLIVPIIALAKELGLPTHTPEQCWTDEKVRCLLRFHLDTSIF